MILKKIFDIFYIFIILLLLLFASLTAYSVLYQKNNFKLFIVQSGSMEPTIKSGSLIFVMAQKQSQDLLSPLPSYAYREGDIITFVSGKETTTHRVVNREEINGDFFYQTQGDANQAPDVEKVNQKDILGKVLFTIPYLGYPLSFARTQKGFIFLIVVPTTLIIHSEIIKIKKELKKYFVGKKEPTNLI